MCKKQKIIRKGYSSLIVRVLLSTTNHAIPSHLIFQGALVLTQWKPLGAWSLCSLSHIIQFMVFVIRIKSGFLDIPVVINSESLSKALFCPQLKLSMSQPRYITRYASQEAFPVIKQRSFKFSILELNKRTEQNYVSVTMCHSLDCRSDTEKGMAEVTKSCNGGTKFNRQ